MIKKTLAVALTALFAMSTHAKVTFETAVAEDRAARVNNNAVNMGALVGGISQSALEGESGSNWKHPWSGSTIGSVGIPSNAKEIFVVTSVGSRSFPKNVGSIILDTVTVSNQGGRATANLTYNGHSITGGSRSVGYTSNCSSGSQNNNSQCHFSTTAEISIKKVMYK